MLSTAASHDGVLLTLGQFNFRTPEKNYHVGDLGCCPCLRNGYPVSGDRCSIVQHTTAGSERWSGKKRMQPRPSQKEASWTFGVRASISRICLTRFRVPTPS